MNRTSLLRTLRAIAMPVILVATLGLLTGCGDDEKDKTRTSTSGAKFNDADVTFATEMIQHHAQALAMVDLTRGRTLDPDFADLGQDILAAQGPEIESMTDWLEDWDEPVPSTVRDHVNADHDDLDDTPGMDHGDDDTGTDASGVMSKEQMADLAAATGAGFRRMWLEMMVEHHQGAITMAKREIEDGVNPDAIELADSIVSSQTAEIDRIEKLLG